jgi:integrase
VLGRLPCPRRKSGAVGSARTGSISTPRGTGTWVRSRSATGLTGSGSGARSSARPSRKSATGSRRSTRKWTLASNPRAPIRCARLWRTGCARAEEARALRWDHVVTWVDDAAGWRPVTTAGFDFARAAGQGQYAIFVWRSERHGGDTKTEKSRRTLALPRRCVEALRQHLEQQERNRLRAGELWQEHGLVFASRVGTPLSANNVIRAFRIITKKASLGEDWVPREMRHTFVSVLSASGVRVESIALLAGHERTAMTGSVYRHEIPTRSPRARK